MEQVGVSVCWAGSLYVGHKRIALGLLIDSVLYSAWAWTNEAIRNFLNALYCVKNVSPEFLTPS